MYDVECVLLSTSNISSDIGVQKPSQIVENKIPIIKVEDVYSNEYYEANQSGFKPTLRLKISSLNYNNEQELKYMGNVYTIIRTQGGSYDEIILICERKIKNV